MTHILKAAPQPYVQSAFCPWVREANTYLEFESVQKYCSGLGLDIGPGGNRFSDTVFAIDSNGTADCDMVWDCFGPMPFKDGTFDFVVSSHVLEDASPEQIQAVFSEWMRLVRPGGHLCLLVPDMEGGRYPDVEDKWTEDDDLVKRGERRAGDCRGNSAHRITMGLTVLRRLVAAYPEPCLVIQSDTLPKDQMTLDFVIQRQ